MTSLKRLLLNFLLSCAVVAQDTDGTTSAPVSAPPLTATANPTTTYETTRTTSPPSTITNETTAPPSSAPPPLPCQAFMLRPADSTQRWIIAHRGASAHLPEHTLAAYRLAMELGANWVEPDLLPTSDGHLIAMHTLDLNVTTNVAQVYGTDRQWHSPYLNRSSWWVFNFTLEELQNLTVVQRLPQARTTLYDGLFGIPSLQDILQLVHRWNTHDLPLWSTNVAASPVGIYAELKDTAWLQHDAGIDLVDVLYRHFDTYRDDWDGLWNATTHRCEHTEGQVPPLVLQCFDAPPLAAFRAKWRNHAFAATVGEPPYVLLVSQPTCWEEEFWFALGEDDRGFLSGLGPDKACLLREDQREAVRTKAHEYQLALHPWTERPESTFVETSSSSSSSVSGPSSSSSFVTMEDELRYLFCDMKVPGLFTESVATAVHVAAMGCDSYGPNSTSSSDGAAASANGNSNRTFESVASGPSPSASPPSSSAVCAPSTSGDNSPSPPSNLSVGLGSFAAGVVLTVVAMLLIQRRNRPPTDTRRRPQQQPYHASSLNEDDFNDLNLT